MHLMLCRCRGCIGSDDGPRRDDAGAPAIPARVRMSAGWRAALARILGIGDSPPPPGSGRGARRLIGVDLAWGERSHSGCAELVWDNGELVLDRVDLLHRIDEIVDWIGPERGDWAVAVDAPLVILNKTGGREAGEQASRLYSPYEAGTLLINLDRFGGHHRGGRLLRELEAHGGQLVEQAADARGRRLVFETYPHIVMVELFGLERTIKYKHGSDVFKCAGQRQLAYLIRRHLCSDSAHPRVRINSLLDGLLREPDSILDGRSLKDREDKLDAIVCAYMSAWLDAGCPLQGLGRPGTGVMVTPALRGIGPPLL